MLAQSVVRTADPIKRGFKESDFPRTVKVADNVYTYEDFHAGDEKFTTTNMFVVTRDGVLLADAQGSPEATRGLVEAIKRVTPQPIKYVVICSDHGDHTAGNAALPAGVTLFIASTSPLVASGLPCASARTPSRVTTNMLVVVNFSSPAAVAIVWGKASFTYRQLNEQANSLANHLCTLGVGPDALVAVCLERSIEMIVACLAILKAGGAYVPLEPSYPARTARIHVAGRKCSGLNNNHKTAGHSSGNECPDCACR